MPSIKNIIIFVSIGAIFVLVYIFWIRMPASEEGLISSAPISPSSLSASAPLSAGSSLITQEFLTLLLSVKKINLDDSIFSDIAFSSLDGSHSITLTQDGTEGRPNPFAPLGNDIVVSGVASGEAANAGTSPLTLPLTP